MRMKVWVRVRVRLSLSLKVRGIKLGIKVTVIVEGESVKSVGVGTKITLGRRIGLRVMKISAQLSTIVGSFFLITYLNELQKF